jgi:hypothetical protein
VNLKLELESECVAGIVRAEMKGMIRSLRDDLKRRKAGHGLAIFSTDKDEDVAEIKRHIAAFETVLKYYG